MDTFQNTLREWPYLCGSARSLRGGFSCVELYVGFFVACLLGLGGDAFGGEDLEAWSPIFEMKAFLPTNVDTTREAILQEDDEEG